MRQGPHPKRGRSRGGNRRVGAPNRNQTFDSNGPEVRIRGNASQVHEKYLALARDAAANGDRVLTESYFQYAEHYYRILNAFNDEGQDGPRLRDNRPVTDQAENGEAVSFAGGPQPDVSPRPPDSRTDPARQLDSGKGPQSDAEVDLQPQPHAPASPELPDPVAADLPEDAPPRRRSAPRQRTNGVDRGAALNGNGSTADMAPGVTVRVVNPETGDAPAAPATPRRRRSRAAGTTESTTLTLDKTTEKSDD